MHHINHRAETAGMRGALPQGREPPRSSGSDPSRGGQDAILVDRGDTTAVRVGTILQGAREQQGFTREAIAHSLQISPKTIRALEESDYAALPAEVYVRGFMRQYAEALGLDPVPLLRALAQEHTRVRVKPVMFPWDLRERQRPRFWEFITPRTLALAGGSAALVAVLLYVFLQVRAYVRAPYLEALSPEADVEIQASSLTVRGRTDPTAELSINGERTAVRDDGSFEETLGVGSGVNALRIVAKSVGGRETVITREVLVRPIPEGGKGSRAAVGPPSPVALRGTGPFPVTVRAGDETVWVSLSADGTIVFSGLLAPGAERTVTGERVVISSGKAAHTIIRVGGGESHALGEAAGALRGAVFTRDSKTGTIVRHESAEVPRE